jgi:hypothetical protein
MIKYKNKQVSVTGKSSGGDTVGVRIFGEGHKTHYVGAAELTADTTEEMRAVMESAPELTVYAVIDADGHYGDQATIYATDFDRAKAWEYAVNHMPAQIICGHGLAVGQKIHSTSIGTLYRAIPVPGK